jgi:hypothetical protein
MKVLIIIIIILLIFIYYKQSSTKETFCAIEYPVCDHYCQKAKYELCLHIQRKGGNLPNYC